MIGPEGGLVSGFELGAAKFDPVGLTVSLDHENQPPGAEPFHYALQHFLLEK